MGDHLVGAGAGGSPRAGSKSSTLSMMAAARVAGSETTWVTVNVAGSKKDWIWAVVMMFSLFGFDGFKASARLQGVLAAAGGVAVVVLVAHAGHGRKAGMQRGVNSGSAAATSSSARDSAAIQASRSAGPIGKAKWRRRIIGSP